jgi:hypothetical protein
MLGSELLTQSERQVASGTQNRTGVQGVGQLSHQRVRDALLNRANILLCSTAYCTDTRVLQPFFSLGSQDGAYQTPEITGSAPATCRVRINAKSKRVENV